MAIVAGGDAGVADDESARLAEQARRLLARLSGVDAASALPEARTLLRALRDQLAWEAMGPLAEAVCRAAPDDVAARCLYAQVLIDRGHVLPAIDWLKATRRQLTETDAAWGEHAGLLGRAYKQLYVEAPDRTAAAARAWQQSAVNAYRDAYRADPARTWQGVNLLALVSAARAAGSRLAPDVDTAELARRIIATIDARLAVRPAAWDLATRAEASLALRDWPETDRAMRAYVQSPDVTPFHLGGTLRQLRQVWDVERTAEGRELVAILTARLARLQQGGARIDAADVERLRTQAPDAQRLEALLGREGPQTWTWWRTGLERARSVAAIRLRLGSRIGTGFLVRGGDIGLEPAAEPVVLTNFHVVNGPGASPGVRPQDVEIVFEAVDTNRAFAVTSIAWSSPVARHDATVLRLVDPPADIPPLPLGLGFPPLGPTARVYVIGYPGGRDLAFSFQDNELLDHEGPPEGQSPLPGVRRLHYRAPTEPGSSGSPVFDAQRWEVVALHHLGGKVGVSRLNGKPGTYGANEGISIESIREAVRATGPAGPGG